jgi:cell division transport system permease protein
MAINPGYFLRESVGNFRRNWVMSLGAVITIYLSLLLVGVFVVSGMFAQEIISSVEQKVQITIFIKDGAAEQDLTAVQQAIVSDPLVSKVTYVSKEQALARFKLEMKDTPEIYRQLENNPLPASLEVELKDPRQVNVMVAKIKANPIFPKIIKDPTDPEKDLRYGQKVIAQLFAFTQVARIVETVFIIMLAIVSLIFINNTIRLAIYARRKEIGIMRLVGASNWFIRTPFLMEGVIQGVLGALLAILTLALVAWTILPRLRDTLKFLPIDLSGGSLAQISLILVLAGGIIGLVGSALAMRRYLRV